MGLSSKITAPPYPDFVEQEGSADIVSLISKGRGSRYDTYKSIIVTLSDLKGGNCPPPPLGTALDT